MRLSSSRLIFALCLAGACTPSPQSGGPISDFPAEDDTQDAGTGGENDPGDSSGGDGDGDDDGGDGDGDGDASPELDAGPPPSSDAGVDGGVDGGTDAGADGGVQDAG
jgi:hypothetical protein